MSVCEHFSQRATWPPRAAVRQLSIALAYCSVVLAHPKRINLDGSASDGEVDEKARALAKEQLAVLASRPPRTQKKAAPPPVQREHGSAT